MKQLEYAAPTPNSARAEHINALARRSGTDAESLAALLAESPEVAKHLRGAMPMETR